MKLFIDSKTATVNGNEVTLEVPAAIENGSTVVPVRFVSEALKVGIAAGKRGGVISVI
ncbi:hypothetical protein D3C71_2205380 [compost metagenome]